MKKVLVCDDEIKIRETIYDYLCAKGFCVTLAENGEKAVYLASKQTFDLIILDVLMPGIDGFEVCRQIRKTSQVPVLFLTALGEEGDYLHGYSSGADDYIVKPFPLAVLVEKCNSIINRYSGENMQRILSVGEIVLNKDKFLVTVSGEEISLTNKMFNLLSLLIENQNIILSREQILNKVWGWDYDGDERVVDTHIKKLRKALGKEASHIHTVIGRGYVIKE
ncbi:MAG: response regulator transcription factor [Clostridia bacterium]|nr:response regulator transcription factor [Clostridia bacterium]